MGMHSKKLSRWLKLIFATLGLTALVGTAISLPSQAVSPTPTPICVDGTCWVTFDYTGDYSVWTPPAGINSLHFDVYGAQGGRAGGKGGSVSGDFAAIPSSLFVYVGGAGASSNSAAGGFNGGGISGNGHGDQGSGGGASDLRTSTSISDRVVVAGGGGGTGGWIGGVGGSGGLTLATAGAKGATATTGGGGGTQTTGGAGGLGVTTGNGTAGSLALGGVGGSGTIAGGGGGGGGFYGGGGGGSDNVSGGSDGAGGGGGSSFATMALTSNISHQAGVRAGNGQVVIRYTFAPRITAFAPTSGATSTSGGAAFQLAFDQFVTDVDPWDFGFSGTATGCVVASTAGDGYTFDIQVGGCSSGTIKLSIRPLSVYGSSFGPATETFASSMVTVDNQPAALKLSSPTSPSNSSVLNFTLTAEEPFVLPTVNAFQISGSGCVISSVTMTNATTAQISIQNCNSGANVQLTVKRNQIHDLAGNLSPASELYSGDILADYEAPTLASITSATSADLVDYSVTFSEPVVNITANAFTLSGPGCSVSKVDGQGSSYHVYVAGCAGSSGLTVKSLAAKDEAGNFGPTSDQSNNNGSVDTLAPGATITELDRTDKSLSPSFELRFDELVTGLTINSLSRSGTAKGCTFALAELTANRVYRVDTATCSQGTLKLTLLPKTVTDSHGNIGPNLEVDSPIAKITQAATVIQPTTFQAFPQNPNGNLHQTFPQAPSVRNGKVTAPALPSRATANMDALKPESWVSIGIALLALALANRPRGRRRA